MARFFPSGGLAALYRGCRPGTKPDAHFSRRECCDKSEFHKSNHREHSVAKVLIVTGAGRGIGAAVARQAAAAGYAVAVNYHRDQAAAETLVASIRATGGTALA
jgi:FlaA1/EpsC-like NDP-sugar epimerase